MSSFKTLDDLGDIRGSGPWVHVPLTIRTGQFSTPKTEMGNAHANESLDWGTKVPEVAGTEHQCFSDSHDPRVEEDFALPALVLKQAL